MRPTISRVVIDKPEKHFIRSILLGLLVSSASALVLSGSSILGESKRHLLEQPFQDPNLSIDDRITNLLSQMTLDEKIACLGTNPSVPRLGIKASGHVEGIHGLTQGGPGKWGRPKTI